MLGAEPRASLTTADVMGEPVVLIADDHEDTRVVLRLFLERGGCRVVSAEDGAEALSLMALSEHKSRGFDAVVLDCMMPGLSGLDVLKAMRGDDRLKAVPVLMYSADASPERQEQAFRLGAQEYVVKGSSMWSSVVSKVLRMAGAPT